LVVVSVSSCLPFIVYVDDFCQAFLPKLEQSLLSSGAGKAPMSAHQSMSYIFPALPHLSIERIGPAGGV
jgi:hypothetical protein